MTNVAIEQLMHDVLDGVATADDITRLEQLLSSDPALRERFTHLQAMFQTLDSVPMEEAPADLHGRLMRAIEAESAEIRNPGWMSALADAFRSRPAPAFAMATVSIAAVGLMLWTAMNQNGLPMTEANAPVMGTMAPIEGAPIATLKSGDTNIRIESRRDGDRLIAILTGEAPSGATLAITFGTDVIGTPRLTGAGAEALADGIDAGCLGLALAGSIDAQLIFDVPAEATGVLSVTLVTETGAVEKEITPGPGGTRP